MKAHEHDRNRAQDQADELLRLHTPHNAIIIAEQQYLASSLLASVHWAHVLGLLLRRHAPSPTLTHTQEL